MTIGADRHLRNDGDVRVHFACRENSLLDLVKIGERLEYEQIASAVLQCLELLAKHRSRLIQAGGPERLETNAEWTNCARDKQIVFGDFARDFRRRAIDLRDLCCEPVLLELDPVGAEAVRLENLGPCFSVPLVNVAH